VDEASSNRRRVTSRVDNFFGMKQGVLPIEPSLEFMTDEGCFILELSNTPGDESVSVARARVAPNGTTQLHQLIGIDERYVITDGEGEVEIGGTITRTVKPGDVVLIPSGTSQRIRNTADSDLLFLCICTPRFDQAAYQALDG
jgi:mannose-6-phosphate isomerase-like protein (cupin superfamily)